MTMYFSKTKNGFYSTEVFRLVSDTASSLPAMPNDVVEVEDDIYEALFVAQGQGKIITADAGGNPISSDPPALTAFQIAQGAAAAAILGGIEITSTSTPSVNGVYDCGADSVANFNAVETYILKCSTFPGPSSEQKWVLKNGSIVSIPTTDMFNEISSAIANYVALVKIYSYSGGQAGTLPSANVTIS